MKQTETLGNLLGAISVFCGSLQHIRVFVEVVTKAKTDAFIYLQIQQEPPPHQLQLLLIQI